MSSNHYLTNLITKCICKYGEMLIETRSTQNTMNNSSANLIHLSSTVNDPDESSNHIDNYEIPFTLPQSLIRKRL